MALLEKHDLAYSSLKFRLLAAQALFACNNIASCIKVLEKEPSLGEDSILIEESESFYQAQRFMILAAAYET